MSFFGNGNFYRFAGGNFAGGIVDSYDNYYSLPQSRDAPTGTVRILHNTGDGPRNSSVPERHDIHQQLTVTAEVGHPHWQNGMPQGGHDPTPQVDESDPEEIVLANAERKGRVGPRGG